MFEDIDSLIADLTAKDDLKRKRSVAAVDAFTARIDAETVSLFIRANIDLNADGTPNRAVRGGQRWLTVSLSGRTVRAGLPGGVPADVLEARADSIGRIIDRIAELAPTVDPRILVVPYRNNSRRIVVAMDSPSADAGLWLDDDGKGAEPAVAREVLDSGNVSA